MWNLCIAVRKTESSYDPAFPSCLLTDNINTSIFHDLNFLIAAHEFDGIRRDAF